MKRFLKGFTLAEIMIVLSVVGVLTAILLPVAFHSAPDENIMKFKKANNTLGLIIRELISSEKYYISGDLGRKPDGSLVESSTYFCETMADIMSVKEVNCSDATISSSSPSLMYDAILNVQDDTYQTMQDAKENADKACKKAADKVGAEIITSDGVTYYQTAPNFSFGIPWKKSLDYVLDSTCTHPSNVVKDVCTQGRLFSGPDRVWHKDANGFDRVYKIFCIDVDGIGKGEDPFGYGIRADGKILPGARADEWVDKTVQKAE